MRASNFRAHNHGKTALQSFLPFARLLHTIRSLFTIDSEFNL